LYDLGEDPFEQINLATKEPKELKRMMQELVALMEKQKAQYPLEKDSKEPVRPKLPQ